MGVQVYFMTAYATFNKTAILAISRAKIRDESESIVRQVWIRS